MARNCVNSAFPSRLRNRDADDIPTADRINGNAHAEQPSLVADTARKHGVSEAAIFIWRKRFGGMDVADARRLSELEAENTRHF